jgi:hypothetical protein
MYTKAAKMNSRFAVAYQTQEVDKFQQRNQQRSSG